MAKNILVPIDGSENSFRAIDLAADLSQDKDDSLTLLHVVRRVRVPEELHRFLELEHIDAPPEWQYEQLVASEILRGGEQRARDRGIASVETVADHGDAAKTIAQVAQEKKADMIVMGSRGLGAIKGLTFGSVSQKVSHLAKQTVVTVS
ncbi:MAG: universal stress protein [Gammaproteobacteria bacterium]|nr:universal stress protein [Gammaproteobacteria bacterium]